MKRKTFEEKVLAAAVKRATDEDLDVKRALSYMRAERRLALSPGARTPERRAYLLKRITEVREGG